MKYRVDLTARAERDRDDAFAWYQQHYSPGFAARWYDGLTRAIRSLSDQPLRCGIARENDRFPLEVRELLFGSRHRKHRVLFTIRDDLVLVLHIRHSARKDLTEGDL